jgi:hypothetical protein
MRGGTQRVSTKTGRSLISDKGRENPALEGARFIETRTENPVREDPCFGGVAGRRSRNAVREKELGP